MHYVDTSALVKLVVTERETPALHEWLAETGAELVSCDLTRTELIRAVRRVAADRVVQARQVLDAVTLINPSTATYDNAALLEPQILRTLDALHLASALELGDDLSGLITYDTRMAEAASALGLAVVAPG